MQTSAPKRRRPQRKPVYHPYTPLETWLELPRTRVLRAMRWFPDGATAAEILDALELPTYDQGRNRERVNHMAAISRAARDGELVKIERRQRYRQRSNAPMYPMYRLAPGFDINNEIPKLAPALYGDSKEQRR